MRRLKKAFSLTLALALSLAMAIPAFAAVGTTVASAPGEPLNITFDGYLRTEYLDSGDGKSFFAVYVVEDGSTVSIGRSEHAVQHGVAENVYGYSPEMGVFWMDSGPISQGGDMSTMTRTAEPAGTAEDGVIYMLLVPGFGGNSYCWMCESDFAKIEPKHRGVPGPDSDIFGTPGPDKSGQPTTPSQPQQPAGTTASPTNDKLEVNGNAANPTVYKIGDSNYFKIRDVAALLNGTEKQFAVGYDGTKNAVTATTGQGYDKQSGDLAGAATGSSQTADPSNDAIYVNGEKITAEVYKINGSNYFKLRDLGKALNFYVGWSVDRGMYIETSKPYSE